MGKEEIVSRILADAHAEAEEIVRLATVRAEEIVRAAEAQGEREKAETRKEAEARAKKVRDGRAATARLDAAKIRLSAKRRVIDGIYLRALASLLALDERESLLLLEKLLKENAEEGDEIVFAENFPYAQKAALLPVLREKGLTVSEERLPLKGGCILRGKRADKDISYGSLLQADRELHQAEAALSVFGEDR